MQTDEHGRVYIEESAVDVQGNVPTTDNHGEWILEGNEIRHHSVEEFRTFLRRFDSS